MNHILPSLARRLGTSLLSLGLLALASCNSLPEAIDPQLGAIERESAAAYLELAQARLDQGQTLRAAMVLIELRKTRGLIPEDLNRADVMLNDAAEQLFAAAQKEDKGAPSMDLLYELDLPTRLRATAGLYRAEQLFEEGHPVLSYRAVTEVERKLPNHPMRILAAEILERTGSYMLAKGGNYNLLFSYRVKGAAALEFLVERYPKSPRCARAYALLATYYESIEDYDLALQRWENLIIYYGQDELVPEASSRMPYLRMQRMRRSDYDRLELKRAKLEIERWLSFYPDLEQAPWMRENLKRCHEQLALADLKVARFYVKTSAALGARMHADRALLEAKLAGSEATIARIEALLAKLPPASTGSFGVESGSDEPTSGPGTR